MLLPGNAFHFLFHFRVKAIILMTFALLHNDWINFKVSLSCAGSHYLPQTGWRADYGCGLTVNEPELGFIPHVTLSLPLAHSPLILPLRIPNLSAEVRGRGPSPQRGPQSGQHVCWSYPGTKAGANITTDGALWVVLKVCTVSEASWNWNSVWCLFSGVRLLSGAELYSSDLPRLGGKSSRSSVRIRQTARWTSTTNILSTCLRYLFCIFFHTLIVVQELNTVVPLVTKTVWPRKWRWNSTHRWPWRPPVQTISHHSGFILVSLKGHYVHFLTKPVWQRVS